MCSPSTHRRPVFSQDGKTALHEASLAGHAGVVQLLLADGRVQMDVVCDMGEGIQQVLADGTAIVCGVRERVQVARVLLIAHPPAGRAWERRCRHCPRLCSANGTCVLHRSLGSRSPATVLAQRKGQTPTATARTVRGGRGQDARRLLQDNHIESTLGPGSTIFDLSHGL